MLVGVVGKPSSGKSTFLNALAKAPVAKTGNYPFTTVKPNMGVGLAYVKCVCAEFNVSCGQCVGAEHLRPIPIKVIDVAGLVPGAHTGRGLGNQFLSELSQADLLIHVIDGSGSLNEEGEEVEAGSHDPLKDIRFLEEEIDQWIFGILSKGWDKVVRTARSARTPIQDIFYDRLSGLKVGRNHLKKVLGNPQDPYPGKIDDWTPEVLLRFVRHLRVVSKPMMLVVNKIDRPTAQENYERVQAEYPDATVVPASALAELALQNFAKAGKIDYDASTGSVELGDLSGKEKATVSKIKTEILDKFGGTGIHNVLTQATVMLDYIAVFPVADTSALTDQEGRVLPDVHLVPRGITAKAFAGRIHKDLFDNFVCGVDARTSKRLGDSYEMRDRDVLKIMSSK